MTFHVRRVVPDDAERLRGIRLAALADAPGSFWQTFADESVRPRADWQARALRGATGNAHATFLLDGLGSVPGKVSPTGVGEPLGMVEVHRPSKAPEFRELAAMWVTPAVRGMGAADALLSAAVDWARTVGALGVRLWVVPTNVAAVRLYARHGFEPIGDPEPDTGDPTAKVYMPMLLSLDERESGSATLRARALAPWTDESG